MEKMNWLFTCRTRLLHSIVICPLPVIPMQLPLGVANSIKNLATVT